jgi:transposase-like protein
MTDDLKKLLPFLWLHGISTRGFEEVLNECLGKGIRGISRSNICRLKEGFWDDEINRFNELNFIGKIYKDIYADASYFNVVGEPQDMCVIAITGVDSEGRKEILRIERVESESMENWLKIFECLKSRGLNAPEAIVGDGGKGLWAAAKIAFPESKKVLCWVHTMRNVIKYGPKNKEILRGVINDAKKIYNAENKDEALVAFNTFKDKYKKRYVKSVKCIEDNLDSLLTFFDFPKEEQKYLKTSNPIESIFSVLKLRTVRFRGSCNAQNLLQAITALAITTNKKFKYINWSDPPGSNFNVDDDFDPSEIALRIG